MVRTASSHPLSRLVRCLLFTALLLAFLTQAAVVQGAAPPTESLTSAASAAPALETYLAPDGTLNLPAGFSGSLDPRGWTLASGANEPPRFIPASPGISGLPLDNAESSPPRLPGDERWEAGFQARGAWHTRALAAGDGSDLYVGGIFAAAGNTVTNHIAKWDGSQWSALGFGLDSIVEALAWDSTRGILYAGGRFRSICTNVDCSTQIPANHVAQWNGAAWSPLDSTVHHGLDYDVYALALDPQHNLYVGGVFTGLCTDDTCASTNGANYIAKWTPSGNSGTWSTLSSGMDNTVWALAWWNSLAGGRLVVGGSFTKAAALDVNYLALWDGSAWSSFWSGVDETVWALAVDPGIGAVVVGGAFHHICATSAPPPTCNTSPATQVNHIAVTTFWLDYWGPLGQGVDDDVLALAVDSPTTKVYVGGAFHSFCTDPACAAGTPASHAAKVDYSSLPYTWSALSSGTDYDIYAFALQANSLYAGGSFQLAGGVPATGIARWVPGSGPWSALNTGDGLAETSLAVAVDGKGNVFVGGAFRATGGIMANNIARWNIQSRTWDALDFGVDSAVLELTVDSAGTLFAGGQFGNVCSNAECTLRSRVNHLARWSDAEGWRSLDYGVSQSVHALALALDGNVYVGGSIDLRRCPNADCLNPIEGRGLLQWTRESNRLGSFGVGAYDGDVEALAFDSTGALYIGGGFVNLCTGACSASIPVNHIAKYKLEALSAPGSGVDQRVRALAVDSKDRVYVGGDFRYTCAALSPCGQATPLNRIGLWTPTGPSMGWGSLQKGLSGAVYAVTVDSMDHLFAAGHFLGTCANLACTTPTNGVNNIAKWDGSVWSPLGSGLTGGRSIVGLALAWHSGIVSVGGQFDMAGGKPSFGFARYADVQGSPALYLPLVVR